MPRRRVGLREMRCVRREELVRWRGAGGEVFDGRVDVIRIYAGWGSGYLEAGGLWGEWWREVCAVRDEMSRRSERVTVLRVERTSGLGYK